MTLTPIAHGLFKVYMKVTYSGDGIARFIPNPKSSEAPPRELTAQSTEFKNPRFSRYKSGETLICTFRVSPNGRRYLLNVKGENEKIEVDSGPAAASVEETPSTIMPLVQDGFYYPVDARRVFTIADKIAKIDQMFAVMMVGPSGYGKTTIPMKFAEATGRKFVRVNCAAIRDPEEWFGFREARGGDTIFEATEFAEAVRDGNSVVVLDEANRIEPWLHNTLFPMLDFGRKTRVHNVDFPVGDNVVIVLTINRGIEYAGTFEMDQAFMNRVGATVHVGPPPQEEETQILIQRIPDLKERDATKIVSIANNLRQIVEKGEMYVDCSTRATLKIAQVMKAGLSLREAYHDVVETVATSEEDRKKIADILNTKLGTMPDRYTGPDIFRSEAASA
jgi:MoxR-like ATPase